MDFFLLSSGEFVNVKEIFDFCFVIILTEIVSLLLFIASKPFRGHSHSTQEQIYIHSNPFHHIYATETPLNDILL